MTHLLYALELSAMSKLLSACSKSISTPLGSYPNVLKSLSQKNIKKFLFKQNFIHKKLGQTYFLDFPAEGDFRFMKMLPQRGDGWDGSDK